MTSERPLVGSAHRPSRAPLLFVALVAVLLVPAAAASAFESAATPAAHAAPSTVTVNPSATTTVTASTPSRGLAGSVPSGVAYVNPRTFNPLLDNASIAAGAATANDSHALLGTVPAAAPSPPKASPYIPTGTFTGYAANASDPSDTLSGVTVEAYPEQGGQFCPSYLCTSETTGTNGEFNVTCPVGQSYVTFTKPFWAQNQTYGTCDLNTTVSLGTVYLLASGVVTGTVEGDVSGDPTISGVTVQCESRDYSVSGSPSVTTGSGGTFKVAIPPGVAGRCDFTSPGNSWQNNFTFLTVYSGQSVDLGTVFLEPNSLVEAKFYDAVTGDPIDGGYDTPDSLTVCSSVTTTCGTQGPPTTYGNTVEALGSPGYDYVQAVAYGYLENNSPIGYVPGTSPGHPFCVPDNCKIYLMPLGGVEVTVDLSGTPSVTYGTGGWQAQICGMDGYFLGLSKYNPVTGTYNTTTSDCITTGCWGVGATVELPAFPLRNDIQVAPNTQAGICSPAPTWPIPGDLPAWGNETAANVTPEGLTDVGYLNLTPGSYIEGSTYVAGTTDAPPNGFAVEVQSRISTGLATYPFEYGQSENVCPLNGPTYFCVPAPPGPDALTLSATGMPSNETWISVPWTCCINQTGPFQLDQVTEPPIDSINVTRQADVNGTVYAAGGTEPLPFASVTACPASPTSTATCAEGIVNRTGGYSLTAVPIGWDVLHASDGGYVPNSQWFYTGPDGVNLTSIPLTPLALLTGMVLAANGSAVIDASITACTIAAAVASQSCGTTLGSGLTTSDGYYQGLVTGGWLPGATYEVQASAPGYETDWTWVNATANATTVVPTLYLAPVGVLASPAHTPSARAGATDSAGTWIDGRMVDNVTGLGIFSDALTACSVSSGICTPLVDGSNTGGFFNDSLPVGIYNLTVSPIGYESQTILISIPYGVPEYTVATLDLVPLPWVFGQVGMNPWLTVAVVDPDTNTIVQVALAPPVTVLACGFSCGAATPDALNGAFQAETSPGYGDSLFINPSYPGSYTSAAGGFVPDVVSVNVTTESTNLTWIPTLPIFVSVSGTVNNAASCEGTVCSDPARWVTASVTTTGVNNAVATSMVNGAGQYYGFVPGGNDQGSTRVTASDPSMYFQNFEVVNALLGTFPGSNLTWVADPIQLTQFGFGIAEVENSVTDQPVAGVGVSASFTDTVNGHSGQTQGKTNGAGFINLTAPSGDAVQFTFGGTNDFNNTTFSAPIPIGNTTNLDTWFTKEGTSVTIPPWGWVASTYANYSAPVGYFGTVVDQWNGLPLPGASIAVSTADPLLADGGSTQSTNALGQFLADAPIGPDDTLTVSLAAYETNTTHPVNITPGVYRTFPVVKLIGDGILASQVIAEPSGLPVSGASVSFCSTIAGTTHQTCATTTTNATGHYWIDVAPGKVSITVSATGYVSNYTETASATTDTWAAIPVFQVVQDGVIVGTVDGLPEGLPVSGALVAACSPIGGTPTGPCSFSVTDLANGSFSLQVAPSQYILSTTATDFNASYIPVSVLPGETVNLGIVPIDEFGILTGTVLDAANGLPVVNASVGGCPSDTLLPCDVPAATDINGRYAIASTPGAVILVVSAPGFLDGYLHASATSGAVTPEPAITIAPIPTSSTVQISGSVVVAGTGAAIGAASVTLWVGSADAASTVTGPSGTFDFSVPSGGYVLTAAAPGYGTVNQTLLASETISNIVLALTPFGWTVSGAVTDGLTGVPVPGVGIWAPGGLLGVTTSAGTYSVELPNGTYNLTAVVTGSSAGLYAPVAFEVQVAAAAVVRDVPLYPAGATLGGLVESAVNQSAIVDAQVTVSGTAVDGHAMVMTAATDSGGRFSVPLYFGSYTVSVTAPGYRSASVTVLAGTVNPEVTLELSPTSSPSSGPSMTDWGYTLLGLAVVGVAVVLVALLTTRRRSGVP